MKARLQTQLAAAQQQHNRTLQVPRRERPDDAQHDSSCPQTSQATRPRGRQGHAGRKDPDDPKPCRREVDVAEGGEHRRATLDGGPRQRIGVDGLQQRWRAHALEQRQRPRRVPALDRRGDL